MTIKTITSSCMRAAEEAAFTAASKAYGEGKLPVLIVSRHDDVVRLRKSHGSGPESFGIAITPLAHWMTDLWELLGDGRTLIEPADRTALMMCCIKEAEGIKAGAGTVSLLGSMAEEALPLIDLDTSSAQGDLGATDPAPSLSPAELAVIEAIKAYGCRIKQAGFIEASQVLQALAAEPLAAYAVFVLGRTEDDLTVLEQTFLASLGATLFVDARETPSDNRRAGELVALQAALFRPDPSHPVLSTGAVRFVLPAGVGARMQAITDEVVRCAGADTGPVVVASRDAAGTFAAIAPRLFACGIGSSFRGMKPFAQTDAGRALSQLISVVAQKPPLNTFLATDFAFNPLSAISWKTAFYFDGRWRGDRLLDNNEILTDLACHTAEEMQGVIGSLESNRPLEAIEAMRTYVASRFDWPESYRFEQLGALGVALDCFSAGARAGLAQVETLMMLEQRAVSVSGVIGGAAVQFLTLDDVAEQPPSSCAVLIVGDLTAASYPVKANRDAKQSIFEKLGISTDSDPLNQMRQVFYRALETPTQALVLERPLNNADAEPAYPAAMFEEVIDCYRTSLTNTADINAMLGVTKNLTPYVTQASEAHLYLNATGLSAPAITHREPWPELGEISLAKKDLIVLPRTYQGGRTFDGLDLSPSQIESYLECPYQWFAKRRLNLRIPDERAGSLERGTFVHAVLKRFYDHFKAEVAPKVTTDTLAQAKTLLAEIFHEQAAYEYLAVRGRRYVPQGQWELRQRDAILYDLFDYLEREVALLPSYEPSYLEWEFGNDDPFAYAGCNIVGTIDRVDVDEKNRRAVVIDYKTGLSSDYYLHGTKDAEAFELPRKMQALMYARVVEELLGYQVVGAVYLNPLKPQMAGAFDATVLDPALLPHISASRNCVPFEQVKSFSELLTKAEDQVAERMQCLARGEVAPDPISKEACKYCPVMLCEKRLA